MNNGLDSVYKHSSSLGTGQDGWLVRWFGRFGFWIGLWGVVGHCFFTGMGSRPLLPLLVSFVACRLDIQLCILVIEGFVKFTRRNRSTKAKFSDNSSVQSSLR